MTTQTAGEQHRPRTYFGWQAERVAFMYGMSGRRFTMLGAAVLLTIWPLAISNLRTGIITWPIAVVLAVLAFLRIGGRTVRVGRSALLLQPAARARAAPVRLGRVRSTGQDRPGGRAEAG